jgi:hypothetical protein
MNGTKKYKVKVRQKALRNHKEYKKRLRTEKLGDVPERLKGLVCKTGLRGSESHRRLQFLREL